MGGAICSAITRNAANVITVVQSSQFNAQTLKVSGIDFETTYVFSLQDVWDELDGSLAITNRTSYFEHITTTANNITQENAGFLTGGNSLPHWRSTTNIVYNEGPLTARLTMYWIGPGLYGPTIYRPTDINIYHYSGRAYFDAGLQYDVTDRLEVYGKINNLLNQDPPLLADNATLKALADTSNIYDRLGRVYGIGLRYRW